VYLKRMRPLRHTLAIAVLLGATVSTGPEAVAARPAGASTLTFLVAGDSHFGAQNVEAPNRSLVEQLNALPGTDYPPAIGGRVQSPRGLLFMGDMTDSSREEEWREFEALFGLTGRDGLLRWPVYEAIGNHDFIGDSPVRGHVERRHGSLVYSWDWEDVHFVCLDMHPDAKNLEWLARDLKRVGRRRPLVVFFHYALQGPYSDFWEQEQKAALARAIEGRNVLAIFHGHYHRAGHYTWRGYDVFLPGSPRHSSHVFLAVRLTRERLDVAFRDFGARRWTETFTKRIRR
jgi:cytolysin (calcineurin-like family phosphatase)